MIFEPTTDKALIKAILSHDDIWERAAEDGVDKDSYWPTVSDDCAWLVCVDDDYICGIVLVHIETSCSVSIHPYLRKKYRVKGKDMMNALYTRFVEHAGPQFVKMNAVIPDCFKSAQGFAKRVGFKEEGVSRSSYMKGGKVYDRKYYGITREEIEALL